MAEEKEFSIEIVMSLYHDRVLFVPSADTVKEFKQLCGYILRIDDFVEAHITSGELMAKLLKYVRDQVPYALQEVDISGALEELSLQDVKENQVIERLRKSFVDANSGKDRITMKQMPLDERDSRDLRRILKDEGLEAKVSIKRYGRENYN